MVHLDLCRPSVQLDVEKGNHNFLQSLFIVKHESAKYDFLINITEAIQGQYFDIVSLLIKAKCDINMAERETKMAPLHSAVRLGEYRYVLLHAVQYTNAKQHMYFLLTV